METSTTPQILSAIKDALERLVKAVTEYQKSDETHKNETLETVARLPIEITKYYESEESDRPVKNRREARRFCLEVAGVGIALVLAILTLCTMIILNGQLTEIRRQTKQSLESFRLDERAWIEIQPISLPSNSGASVGAFRYELYPKNVGKTSATNITIYATRGVTLNSITMGDSASNVGRLQDMLVSGVLSDIPRVNPISKVLAPNTVSPVPFLMDGQSPQIFPKDEFVSYLIGKINYTDAFNISHWLRFCFFVVDAKGNLWNCKKGNDEDRNPEFQPN